MKIKREKIALIITIVMTTAFFITLLWGYGQYQQSRRAFNMLENQYQRAYYNYFADIRDLAENAGKAQSVGALQCLLLMDRLNSRASVAADHMSQLPVQHGRYQKSVAYLNQLGDYAASLGQKLARGGELSNEDRQNLADIYTQLQDIYAQMAQMEQAVSGGELVFAAAGADSWWQAARVALGSRAAQSAAAAADFNSADGFFNRANALLDKVEPLNYSGKYSAHLANLPARGLIGKRRVEEQEALTAAKEFMERLGFTPGEPTESQEIKVTPALPLYQFYFADEGEDIYIAVSEAGGQIVSFTRQRDLGPARLSAEQALIRARDALEQAGHSDMRLISRQAIDGELLLRFVPHEDGALCYPDSVDIKVALDNGDITAFNAHQYWLYHQKRVLPPDMPADGAMLAFISDGAGGELLCQELRHSVGNEEYLSFIGLQSGEEEQVLRYYAAEDGSFYTR